MKKMNLAVVAALLAGMSLSADAKGRTPETANNSPTVDEQQTRPNDPYRGTPPPIHTNPAYNNPTVLPGTPGTESQRGTGNLQGSPNAATNTNPTGAPATSGTGGPNSGMGSPGTSGAAASGSR
jgi:hypothetical protein